MSTIGHVAGETAKWAFALLVLLPVTLILIVAVVMMLADLPALPGAVWGILWGERELWAVIGVLLVVALAWAQIKGD